jgi:SAM-dependent methyltransferase
MPGPEPTTGRDTLYGGGFYEEIGPQARASAEVVVPIVNELCRPASVIDVGCGTGAWLAAWQRHGVADILGVDGDHVQRADLEIEPACFIEADLERPSPLDRTFDLAMSLEVGEHLSPNAAGAFVDFLASAAPVVLFSAATPHQGGTGHINEQWPSYWAALFADHGHRPFDVVRPRVWSSPGVAGYYAQNMVLYANDDRLDDVRPRLPLVRDNEIDAPLSLVHPGVLEEILWWRDRPRPPESLTSILRRLPAAGATAMRRRLRDIRRS